MLEKETKGYKMQQLKLQFNQYSIPEEYDYANLYESYIQDKKAEFLSEVGITA